MSRRNSGPRKLMLGGGPLRKIAAGRTWKVMRRPLGRNPRERSPLCPPLLRPTCQRAGTRPTKGQATMVKSRPSRSARPKTTGSQHQYHRQPPKDETPTPRSGHRLGRGQNGNSLWILLLPTPRPMTRSPDCFVPLAPTAALQIRSREASKLPARPCLAPYRKYRLLWTACRSRRCHLQSLWTRSPSLVGRSWTGPRAPSLPALRTPLDRVPRQTDRVVTAQPTQPMTIPSWAKTMSTPRP